MQQKYDISILKQYHFLGIFAHWECPPAAGDGWEAGWSSWMPIPVPIFFRRNVKLVSALKFGPLFLEKSEENLRSSNE